MSARLIAAALVLAAAWGCTTAPAAPDEQPLRSTAASGTASGTGMAGESSGRGVADPTTGNPLDPGAGAPYRDPPTSSTSGSTGSSDEVRPSRTDSTGGGAGPRARSAAVPA